MTHRIAVIAGTPKLVETAHRLGVDVVLVSQARQPGMTGAAQTVWVDRLDAEEISQALAPFHHRHPFTRVLSLTESGLLPAAEVAERLGITGNPLRTVALLQDKRRMRELLADTGVSPMHTRSVSSAADVRAFCEAVGGPVVLKPATGSGSRSVLRVNTPQEATPAWARFSATGGADALAEEYLDGPEFSVEAFSHQSRHVIIGITDKLILDNFVEYGHTMPSRLSAEHQAEISQLVQAFLQTVGVREGPTHTEVKLTRRGPRIIESHNRIGGAKIRELLRLAYGLDLVALTVAVPLGLSEPPLTTPLPLGGAAIRFILPEPGVVQKIDLPAVSPSEAAVIDIAPGDTVREVRCSADRPGYVLAGAHNAAAAAQRCEQLLAQVLVETM